MEKTGALGLGVERAGCGAGLGGGVYPRRPVCAPAHQPQRRARLRGRRTQARTRPRARNEAASRQTTATAVQLGAAHEVDSAIPSTPETTSASSAEDLLQARFPIFSCRAGFKTQYMQFSEMEPALARRPETKPSQRRSNSGDLFDPEQARADAEAAREDVARAARST